MWPLRLSGFTNSTDIRDVPGVRCRGLVRAGPPVNCRLLLKSKPILPTSPDWRIPRTVKPVIDGIAIKQWLVPYQNSALAALQYHPGPMLFWPTGSGKTAAAILWSQLDGDKTVVVTRSNTKRQWKLEVQKFTTLKARILNGQTVEEIPSDIDLVILNWEILPHWLSTLKMWAGPRASVIYDEIHRAKNWKRTEKGVDAKGNVIHCNLRNISSSAAAFSHFVRRRLGLTATPIRDRISDLWSQLDILEPGCWGSNWDFVHRYADAKPGKYGGLDTSGRSNTQELKLRLAMSFHVVTRDELARHLPAKRRQIAYLDKEDQNPPARGFKTEFKRAAKAGPAAILEIRLAEAATRKRKWIVDTVVDAVESGQKVVIFTGRRKDCDTLGKTLAKRLATAVRWAHGGNPLHERESLRVWYRDNDEPCVLVGTHDAWGEAIDGLQCTDLAIFAMLPWTPGSVTQSEGRFCRHGQTRPVLILYVVAAGTADERVSEVLLDKLEAVRDTLDDTESGDIASVLSGEADEDAIIASILADFQGETNGEP